MPRARWVVTIEVRGVVQEARPRTDYPDRASAERAARELRERWATTPAPPVVGVVKVGCEAPAGPAGGWGPPVPVSPARERGDQE